MAAPVTAPYAPSYAATRPYLTPAEYLAEPTGVDVSQLLPQVSNAAAQNAALVRQIQRASSWADQYVRKVLAATSDIQSGEYRIFRDGTIRVPVDNTPLIQVTAVSLGYAANAMAPMADLSGLRLGRKVVRIPVTTVGGQTFPRSPVSPAACGSVFADVTYINGYAHGVTTAGSAAGDIMLQVDNPAGIVPGLQMTVYDGAANGANTEQVVVGPSYLYGSNFVPLAAQMGKGHPAGCSVSALPPFVRQAVISMTSFLIKTRGADSFVMPEGPGPVGHEVAMMPGATEDVDLAMELLEPLRRVW